MCPQDRSVINVIVTCIFSNFIGIIFQVIFQTDSRIFSLIGNFLGILFGGIFLTTKQTGRSFTEISKRRYKET